MSDIPGFDRAQAQYENRGPIERECLSENASNQLKYEFIEDGPDDRVAEFYDWCWDNMRNHMRTLIEAYVDGAGNEAFEDWLQAQQETERDWEED